MRDDEMVTKLARLRGLVEALTSPPPKGASPEPMKAVLDDIDEARAILKDMKMAFVERVLARTWRR